MTLTKNVCCANSRKRTEKVRQRVHPEKTKILSNRSSDTRKEIEVDDIKVEILTRGESSRHLGQMVSFLQQETTEIRNRTRAAWTTFYKFRQELTSKNYQIKHGLRLFDAVINPTICHASGTWTPTKEHERMTQSTQRKILRLIIQTKRRYKRIVKRKDISLMLFLRNSSKIVSSSRLMTMLQSSTNQSTKAMNTMKR